MYGGGGASIAWALRPRVFDAALAASGVLLADAVGLNLIFGREDEDPSAVGEAETTGAGGGGMFLADAEDVCSEVGGTCEALLATSNVLLMRDQSVAIRSVYIGNGYKYAHVSQRVSPLQWPRYVRNCQQRYIASHC
jgi:hypothetical protein